MPTVVQNIVNDVITALSQVPGVATQIYAADRIRLMVQNAWQMEIHEMWWPGYMYYQNVPVDTGTGLLTADLQGPISYVDNYEDIAAVYAGGRNRKLREFPQSLNPSLVTGGRWVWYMMPDYTQPHRPFKVTPPINAGSVVVWARQTQSLPFAMTDNVYLDPLLLQYDACWMYTVDDGTVPAQVNKFQMLAANRRKSLKAALAQQPLELDPRFPDWTVGDGWFTTEDYFVVEQDPLA